MFGDSSIPENQTSVPNPDAPTEISKWTSVQPSTRDVEVGHVQDLETNSPLQKSFSLWSALGLQYSLTSTPLAVGTYLASVIGVGGSPVFIFGYVLAVGCNLCVCVSLAEIAAVYPHTSGALDSIPLKTVSAPN